MKKKSTLKKQKNTQAREMDEIPPITAAQFAKAVFRRNFKPVEKKSLFTMRVDSEVLKWFRNLGSGYQTRMSQILKAYMDENLKHNGR